MSDKFENIIWDDLSEDIQKAAKRLGYDKIKWDTKCDKLNHEEKAALILMRQDNRDDDEYNRVSCGEDKKEEIVLEKVIPAVGRSKEKSSEKSTSSDQEKVWMEPNRVAATVTLCAKQETSLGKRRLAKELSRIMVGDTTEQGFRLEPLHEDSMKKLKIVLFAFDEDSQLAKDLKLIGMDGVELEMSFPEQYPFKPPFVRIIRPKFVRNTGYVINGALCMELLTTDGWNPANYIESVIISIRSMLVAGNGRVEAASVLQAQHEQTKLIAERKNHTKESTEKVDAVRYANDENFSNFSKPSYIGEYSEAEARRSHAHLSLYHKKNGWFKIFKSKKYCKGSTPK